MKSREVKHDEAIKRKDKFLKLNPQEKLTLLDTRLGKDTGARRERAKLHKLLEVENA